MIATLTALLSAHVLADFLFQPDWMVARKRRPEVLALHAALVFLSGLALLGPAAFPELLALACIHAGIDLVKLGSGRRDLAAFLLDQGAHVASVFALAALAPGLWAASPWAGLPAPVPSVILHAALWAAGLLAATRAGGFAVGLLMARPAWRAPTEGLGDGGRIIGLLERGLIYLLLVVGQQEAIGFLIAAKSILRFGTVAEDRAASEYVIIGTLASFGWAVAVTFAVIALEAGLPPLEIPAPTP